MAPNRKACWLGGISTLFFLMQICVTPSLSAEIRVPYDYATITEALAVADDNDAIDTILVAPRTYSEPNEEFPLRIRKAIALICDSDDPNSDRTKYDPNDPNSLPHMKGDGKHTIVLIESGGVTIQGFRITDGSGSEGINSMDGGGICVFVAPGETRDVNIVNCLIENNTCPSDETYDGCGGGIYCGGTYCECFTVNVSNCVIRNNSIRGCGGGVFCALLSIVNINDNTYIEDNTAEDHGGGVFVDFYASVHMSNTQLVRNNCPGDTEKEHWGGKGGGLACESLGIFTATDCSFAENTAKYFGGGIFTRGGLFDVNDLCGRNSEFSYVSNSHIKKNRADVSGGGAYIASSGILAFSKTTLYWNDAGQDGGAVFVAGGAIGGGIVDFNNGCILEGNESANKAGGIYLGPYAHGTFKSTRFLGNSSLFDAGALLLDTRAIADLNDCLVTYNNSARGYAGGIRATAQSWLDLVHCSIVGNFAPFKRSGLYLDPNSVVNIRDSILWRNAGGSVEANGATVNINASLNEDGADPNNGVICCDPGYIGWDDLEEIYVDSSGPYPGVGTLENPYYDLQVALNDFDFSLAENSPCMNTASDAGNMGMDTGVGDSAGSITAKLHIIEGTYDIRGRNIIFISGMEGIDPNTSVIKHAVLGYIEDANIMSLGITGEEIFGGITIRADVNFVDCNIAGNTVLADGGGVYVADGNCMMTNTCILSNTSTRNGGGIFLSVGVSLNMTFSSVEQNSASNGGGICADVNSISIITGDSTISSNIGTQGAGIYVSGVFQITDTNIIENRAERAGGIGGGIYVNTTANAEILRCSITSNYAAHAAGGLFCLGETIVDHSQFEQNNANYGGAIDINPPGELRCEECVFRKNKGNRQGGVIWCLNRTSPVFLQCEFDENTSQYGGVGYCNDGSLASFETCEFTKNSASSGGGCFYLKTSGTHIRRCNFTENGVQTGAGGVAWIVAQDVSVIEDCVINKSVAGSGGAIVIANEARPVFSNVQITDGWAKYYGGGISIIHNSEPLFVQVSIVNCSSLNGGGVYAGWQSSSVFKQCSFLNNQALATTTSADGGGAFFTEDANGWFTNCVFQDNYATDDGGGLAVEGASNVYLCNALFSENTALNTGGGAYFTSTSVGTFTNCTLVYNNAVGESGGGIYLDPGNTVNIDSSIVFMNNPDGIRQQEQVIVTVNYCCVQETCLGTDNIVDDPLLGPNSFGLLDGSPCIDAGNPDPNMNDACQPPGKRTLRNDMGITGGPDNCLIDMQKSFNFTTFSEPAFLVLRGHASFLEGVLSLTKAEQWQVGGVWYALPVNIQGGFETEFDFRIDRDGRDGIAFVIQNDSLTALGNNAEYIGYNILNSIAVEFDTHKNGNYDDTNANHISIQTRGNQTNNPNHEYSWAYNDSIPFLSDNQVHTAKVIYVPGELSVFVDNMEIPALIALIELDNELTLMEGRAYIGFTSSTRGGLVESHDILRWSFASTATQ